MASINYAISEYLKIGAGKYIFLLKICNDYRRVSEVMPAILDYDKTGEIFRIEITFLRGRLDRVTKTLDENPVTGDTEIVLQVGQNNPTSLLLWVDKLYEKSAQHTSADAWLLENNQGAIVGLEIILPQ